MTRGAHVPGAHEGPHEGRPIPPAGPTETPTEVTEDDRTTHVPEGPPSRPLPSPPLTQTPQLTDPAVGEAAAFAILVFANMRELLVGLAEIYQVATNDPKAHKVPPTPESRLTRIGELADDAGQRATGLLLRLIAGPRVAPPDQELLKIVAELMSMLGGPQAPQPPQAPSPRPLDPAS